jgi:drug/metabolite transporter (DMT)-like permease
MLSVLMNAVAQVSLKRGILALKGVTLIDLTRPKFLIRILKNPSIAIWIGLLLPSMLLWLKALSITDLSFAYPFQSLNFVFISLGSILFLKERITGRQGSGIFMILVGIILISRS